MWQSNIVSASTLKPNFILNHSAQSLLFSRFTCTNLSRNPASSASDLSRANCSRSVIHALPMASVIKSASGGFASKSQRRGVTPLVLLLNLSGNISARSLTVMVRNNSE